MSALHIIQTIIEICMALFVIWCFINEQKLIRFEDKIKAYIVYRYRKRQRRRLMRQRAKIHRKCAYSPETPTDGPLYVA